MYKIDDTNFKYKFIFVFYLRYNLKKHILHKKEKSFSQIFLNLFPSKLVIYDLQCYPGKHFEMKDLGTFSYFLSFEISSSAYGYYLSQTKYAFDLLSRSGIIDYITSSIPLDPNVRLTPFDGCSFWWSHFVLDNLLVAWFT